MLPRKRQSEKQSGSLRLTLKFHVCETFSEFFASPFYSRHMKGDNEFTDDPLSCSEHVSGASAGISAALAPFTCSGHLGQDGWIQSIIKTNNDVTCIFVLLSFAEHYTTCWWMHRGEKNMPEACIRGL